MAKQDGLELGLKFHGDEAQKARVAGDNQRAQHHEAMHSAYVHARQARKGEERAADLESKGLRSKANRVAQGVQEDHAAMQSFLKRAGADSGWNPAHETHDDLEERAQKIHAHPKGPIVGHAEMLTAHQDKMDKGGVGDSVHRRFAAQEMLHGMESHKHGEPAVHGLHAPSHVTDAKASKLKAFAEEGKKREAEHKMLQRGKKGGSFYVSKGGRKVYTKKG